MIDDIQIENSSAVDLEPAAYGFIAGFQKSEVLGKIGFLIGCEYVRITNRTYNSAFEWENFLHRNKPIGYYLGNDFDKWSFYLNKWLSKDFFIKGGLDYIRRGEETVKSDWDTQWMTNTPEDEYNEPFPTGIVEKSLIPWFCLRYLPWANSFIDVKIGYRFIKNFNNIKGKEEAG